MTDRFKLIILIFGIFCLSLGMSSQEFQNHPPQPQSQNAQAPDLPCGRGYAGKPYGGGGQGNIPPPVGLCLPINEYLLPLLVVGIFLGGYKVWSMEKAAVADTHN